jgi:hypothetical protein
LLYHYLTGDRKSLDTALEVGSAIEYYWTHSSTGEDKVYSSAEVRIQGWSIENLLALYHLSNQKHYLDLAKEVYFKYTRRFISPQGYVGNKNNLNIFQPVLAVEPFIKLDREIEDNSIKDDILRMVTFLKEKGYKGGVNNTGDSYQPLYLPNRLSASSGLGTLPSPPFNLMMANAYAYSYMITGQTEYMKFARRIFRDYIFYWQIERFVDPDHRSAITFNALHFPGSLSKVHGWFSRYPMIYLYAESWKKADFTPPAAIKDLEVRPGSPGSAILDWTAPGDDGMEEKASSYQIKYSQDHLDNDMLFFAARNVRQTPIPQKPGSLETFTVEGLIPGKRYFFAVRCRDEEQNMSLLSNVVSIKLKKK